MILYHRSNEIVDYPEQAERWATRHGIWDIRQ